MERRSRELRSRWSLGSKLMEFDGLKKGLGEQRSMWRREGLCGQRELKSRSKKGWLSERRG